MNTQQRLEVRELIEDVIGRPLAEISGQLNILSDNTKNLAEYQKVANGRTKTLEACVSDLQKVNLLHTVNCPNTKILNEMEIAGKERKENCPYKSEIETLKTDRISRASVVKFILAVVGVSASLAAIFKYFG